MAAGLNIGIDISDYRLRLVALRSSYRRLNLVSFNEVDLPSGIMVNGVIQQPEQMVEALKSLLKSIKGGRITQHAVRAGLPEQQSFFVTVPTTSIEREDIEREAIKNIPFKRDEMYFDTKLSKNKKTITIAAGKKEFVDQYIEVLEQAGLHLTGLTSETDAISHALFKGHNTNGVGHIIMDIGYARTTVIFYIRGEVYFTTSYPSIIEVTGINQKNLTAVVQQIIYFYQSHYAEYAQIENIILCGSGAYTAGITEMITKFSDVRTQLGDPFSNLKINRLAKKIKYPLAYSTAIGLALE